MMRFALLTVLLFTLFKLSNAQKRFSSIGLNLVGPAELFDVHTNIRLKSYHHFLQIGATWKPTSNKFALIDDLNYLVFPIQYQYHFFVFRKIYFDANAGMQVQYNVNRYLPNQLKVTPILGFSATKNFNYNCYYIRAGVNLFVPHYFYADKYEAFTYPGSSWLFWPQLGFGKYLH